MYAAHYLSSAPRVQWEIIKRLVAAKLMGVSPLPGSPPAPWGSIIITERHRRHRQMPFGFRCISFIADPFGVSRRTYSSRLKPSGFVLDECLFNFHSSISAGSPG